MKTRSQKTPVYLYEVSHEPSRSFTEKFGLLSGASQVDFGVSHSDDLLLVFMDYQGLNGSVVTSQDQQAQVCL